MTELMVIVIVAVAIAGALALTIWRVISLAMGNLFDWFVLTFGNEDAVRAMHQSKKDDSARAEGGTGPGASK